MDDVLQDAFLMLPDVLRARYDGDSVGRFVARAADIARHRFSDRSATGGAHTRTRADLEARRVRAIVDPDAQSPEDAATQRERVHHLSEMVERMPPTLRRVLVAREIEGLDPSEVADRFGLRRGSVVALTARARARLSTLAADGPMAEEFNTPRSRRHA
jgi:RNA polymerase sigma factor (sigma-70 family)